MARAKANGCLCLQSDPLARDVGVDAGFVVGARLVAPHLAVGELGGARGGWATGAPSLAVEYAGFGRDEFELQRKLGRLLDAGTGLVWVVRLSGPRRVEIYQKGQLKRVKYPGARLAAPGVLKHAPLVEALYEREAAFEQASRNLLDRAGRPGPEALRDEGEARGRARALLTVLEARGLSMTASERARILDCVDLAQLERWGLQAPRVRAAAELFAPAKRPKRAPR